VHTRAPGRHAIEDFDVADAKEAVQGAPAQQWPAIGQYPRTGNRSPATIAALLVQGYTRPANAVALQRALHGPFTGASPSPRGLGPQRVERAYAVSTPPSSALLTYPKRITARPPRSHKQLRTRWVRFR
jgi:hypothetical protein